MREFYQGNQKIILSGSRKDIDAARTMLDSIPDLDLEMDRFRFTREGHLRQQIQDQMEKTPIKATVLVDGNTVYPLSPYIKEFRRLRKTGVLEKMTDRFYAFLYCNFDVAHYDKAGYIATYHNNFWYMFNEVLAQAHTPAWHADVQNILDAFWEDVKDQCKKGNAA